MAEAYLCRVPCRTGGYRLVRGDLVRTKATSDVWWKNAVLCCVAVQCFLDADGDGRGDLQGLTDRLDYLSGIGVTCLWLMPFYPSPRRDDGYDIVDFYGVDPGSARHGDFAEMLRTARDRGIRVIADLVMNHTSDQHPWFQAARADRDSPYRDFYVWARREARGEARGRRLPRPRELQLGLGRRGRSVLPAPLLLLPARPQRRQPAGPRRDRPGRRLLARPGALRVPRRRGALHARADGAARGRDARSARAPARPARFLSRRVGEAILIGEVNLDPKQQREFFGDEDGDELHMVLTSPSTRRCSSRSRASRRPRSPTPCVHCPRSPRTPVGQLRAQPRRAHAGQAQRGGARRGLRRVRSRRTHQLYGRGLRRRLPTMLDGDRDRIRLAYSLAFSLPGTPSSSTARRSGWPRTSTSRAA